jgi:DNA-binding transcriptional MocR family regulator
LWLRSKQESILKSRVRIDQSRGAHSDGTSFYGMHLTALAHRSVDLSAVSRSLLSQGVSINALDRYYIAGASNSGLVLGYGAVEPRDITHGVALLRREISM